MRPLYETAGHLAKESATKALLEKKFNCTLSKIPMKMGLDFAALRNGEVVAFLELKCRNATAEQYPTYMLSLHKLMAAKNLTSATNLPCFLAVQWTDNIGFVALPPPDMKIRLGGRADRNDPDDIEPVVHFPISRFKMITP